MTPQQQYISEWHDNFVNFIGGLLGFIESLIILPEATDEDKRAINQIKLMLNGKDAKDIESTLAKSEYPSLMRPQTTDWMDGLWN